MSYILRKNRRGKGSSIIKGPPGIGFKLTNDGDYDVSDRKIVNLRDPNDDQDAVNVFYIKDIFQNIKDIINQKQQDISSLIIKEITDILKISLIKNNEGFDCKDEKIINLKNPNDDQDAVNLFYIRGMFEKFGIEMLQKTFLKYEDLNLNYKRITNLSIPMDKNDAVNLFHIMGMFEKFNIKVNEKIDTELQKTFLRVRQFFNENAITAQYFHENAITFAKNIKYISLKDKFRFTSCGAIPDKFEADTLVPARYVLCQEKDDKNANYTAKNKRIINVSDPVDDKDAVNKGFLKNIPRSFCIKYNNTIASSNYPPGISSHVNPSGVIYDFLFDVDKSFLKYNKGFFSIKKKNLLLRITLYRGTAGGELGLNVRDGVNPEYSHYRKKDVVYDSIILKLNQNMEFYIYCTIDNTLIGVIEDFCFYS